MNWMIVKWPQKPWQNWHLKDGGKWQKFWPAWLWVAQFEHNKLQLLLEFQMPSQLIALILQNLKLFAKLLFFLI